MEYEHRWNIRRRSPNDEHGCSAQAGTCVGSIGGDSTRRFLCTTFFARSLARRVHATLHACCTPCLPGANTLDAAALKTLIITEHPAAGFPTRLAGPQKNSP